MKISDLLENLSTLVGRISGIVTSLPDANSLDKDSPVAVQSRNLEANARELENVANDVKKFGQELSAAQAAEPSEEQLEALKAKLVAAGDLLSKTDHEAALQTAVAAKETELNAGFAEQQTLATQVENNRAKLGEKVTNAKVLAAIPAAVLSADNFEVNSAKIIDRFAKLEQMGIKADGALSEVASMAVDADGDTAFETRTKLWEELSKGAAGSGQGGAGATPGSNFGDNVDGDKPGMLI